VNVIARVALVALAVAGCTMQGPYVRPPVAVPETWRTVHEVSGAQPLWPSRDWWGAFGDTTLNELEERAPQPK
jgi:outer membrane protein TolC